MTFKRGFVRIIKEYGCRGKKIAVTGASGGIGVELCRLILASGGELIVVDRNVKKQAALIEMLKGEFEGAKIEGELCDMSTFTEVKSLADRLIKRDITDIILNAGAYNIPVSKSDTGCTNIFTINCIAPLYLARALLPTLKKNGGKAIAVGSIAHRYSHADVDDIDFARCEKASRAYGNAKRYLMYAFFKMRQRGEPVVVAHPGITVTGMTSHYPEKLYKIIKYPMKVIFMRPKVACLSIFYSLFVTPLDRFWIGPAILDIWGWPEVSELRSCGSEEYEFISETMQEILDMQEIDN